MDDLGRQFWGDFEGRFFGRIAKMGLMGPESLKLPSGAEYAYTRYFAVFG
jgi:hypothetical protein